MLAPPLRKMGSITFWTMLWEAETFKWLGCLHLSWQGQGFKGNFEDKLMQAMTEVLAELRPNREHWGTYQLVLWDASTILAVEEALPHSWNHSTGSAGSFRNAIPARLNPAGSGWEVAKKHPKLSLTLPSDPLPAALIDGAQLEARK